MSLICSFKQSTKQQPNKSTYQTSPHQKNPNIETNPEQLTEVRKMLAKEYKGSKIALIEWWYVGLRQYITFPDLKDVSRLQSTRLPEESKYHYKYFGDNQTDKQSVMTILNYVASLRRDKYRIQNLRPLTPFAVITARVNGQKRNHSLVNLWIIHILNLILFCFTSFKESEGSCSCQAPLSVCGAAQSI